DEFSAVPGSTFPAGGHAAIAERFVQSGEILLHLMKQHVETDRSVVNDIDVEGAETVGRIKARFAHGAIAFIEQVGETVYAGIVGILDIVILDFVQPIVLAAFVEVSAAMIVALGNDHFGSGTYAEIIITGEAGGLVEVGRHFPKVIALLGGRDGGFEP